MGLFSYAALGAVIFGNPLNALVFMGLDVISDTQERKDREEQRQIESHNSKHGIAEHEYMQWAAWAFGESNLATLDILCKLNKNGAQGLYDLMVTWWNERNGHTHWLDLRNPVSHNIGQMIRLWIRCGKP